MNTTNCPNFQELLDFERGVLTSDERIDWLARHVDDCDACAAELLAADKAVVSVARAAEVSEPVGECYLDEPQFQIAVERIREVPVRAAHLAPGDRVGDYEVIERIGAGGMGAVYHAWHFRLKRHVVLKRLRERVAVPNSPSHQRVAELFRGEMAVLGQLDDSRIVKAYDALAHDGGRIFGDGVRRWAKPA
jgi:GAF domain-containing protein